MKILYQRVAATSGMDPRYRTLFDKWFPDVDIDVRSWEPRGNKPSHVGYYNGDIILAASKAKEEGFDAMVISCFGDPSVKASKKQTNIPVVGLAEANMLVASTFGTFSVFSPGVKTSPYSRAGGAWDLARGMGLDSYMVSLRGLDIVRPVDSDDIAMKDPNKWADIIWEMHREALEKRGPMQAVKAVKEDGAKAICLGCAFWAGWKKEIKAMESKANVPVLDPTYTAVKYAKMLAELRQ